MFTVLNVPSGAEQRVAQIVALAEKVLPHIGYTVGLYFHDEAWGGSTTTAPDSETIHVNGWHTFRSPVQDVVEAIGHEEGHQFDGHFLTAGDRECIWAWFDKQPIVGWETRSSILVPYGDPFSWVSRPNGTDPLQWNYRLGEAFASQFVKTFWPQATPPFPRYCKPSKRTARRIARLIKSRLP